MALDSRPPKSPRPLPGGRGLRASWYHHHSPRDRPQASRVWASLGLADAKPPRANGRIPTQGYQRISARSPAGSGVSPGEVVAAALAAFAPLSARHPASGMSPSWPSTFCCSHC